LIDSSKPVAQIVKTIQDEYDVTESEAARDCLELFDALQTAGLIRPSL
jgi:hypothetical protein